jgi:hypothetical protein
MFFADTVTVHGGRTQQVQRLHDASADRDWTRLNNHISKLHPKIEVMNIILYMIPKYTDLFRFSILHSFCSYTFHNIYRTAPDDDD